MDMEVLVKSAQHGDEDAFFLLISHNKDRLYGIAYSYFKNEPDSLEAIQEVTCRAYLKLQKLKEPQYFSTWLVRIMINYCIDEKKRKEKFILVDRDYYADADAFNASATTDAAANTNPNVAAESSVSSESSMVDHIDLEAAVDKLESKYKKVILLKYFNDMTVPDIAKVMECPEGTIKTWVSRALGQLRVFMNREGDLHV